MNYRDEVYNNVEKDGRRKAYERAQSICNIRGGKFKLSEKQFVEEMVHQWVCGEFSAAERVLKGIEIDPELNTKDLIRGEIHLFILDLCKIIERRSGMKIELKLEDLIDGKYSTEVFLKQQEMKLLNASV